MTDTEIYLLASLWVVLIAICATLIITIGPKK
jgi:hypothetical protein